VSGFPECRNAKPILEDAGITCPKCGGKVYIKRRGKAGNILVVRITTAIPNAIL